MSPVCILSRLCLNRRFQFFGISVPPDVRYLTTFLTASSSITLRSPTRSALSAGTFTVMSLCRILIVRYSRFSPRTSRRSRFTTVPAPWWGYTTLSPTLYKLTPSPVVDSTPSHQNAGHMRMTGEEPPEYQIWLKSAIFAGVFAVVDEKALLRRASRRALVANAGGSPPPGSHLRFPQARRRW